jgi:hypothetical protein
MLLQSLDKRDRAKKKESKYFLQNDYPQNSVMLRDIALLSVREGLLDGPGLDLGGGKRADRQWDPPSILYNRYRVFFSEIKRSERVPDSHPIYRRS